MNLHNAPSSQFRTGGRVSDVLQAERPCRFSAAKVAVGSLSPRRRALCSAGCISVHVLTAVRDGRASGRVGLGLMDDLYAIRSLLPGSSDPHCPWL
jgi:hypothetical protein